MLVKIITFFTSEEKDADPQYVIGGDYTSVGIYESDKLIQSYGDYYHDKGTESANGFVQGLKYTTKKLTTQYYSSILESGHDEPPTKLPKKLY